VLRTNLATRPFYNERAVHMLLGVAALLIFVITVVNVIEVVRLSRHNTELSTRVGRDRAEAQRLSAEAAKIRRGIDQNELKVVVAAAREANTLIDQRTFSWTAFFNHIESTLPGDVMLTSVRPAVDEEGTRVTMGVLGRRYEDIDEFIQRLRQTGAFPSVLVRQSDETDEGLQRVVLDTTYVPASSGQAAERGGRP
jgi:Tfp pilus assembly protein PilN